MKKQYSIIILILIFGCKNISESENSKIVEKSNNNKYLIEQSDYRLKKLKLKPITEFESKIIRIWKFPGGGAAFEQMIEYDKSKSELIFHSYLLKEHENNQELSKLNFSKNVTDKKLKKQLNSVISKSDFMNTKDSNDYCDPFWGCADYYIVEFTNGEKVSKFTISHDIEKCHNPKAEYSKRIFQIVNQVIKKYSR